MYKLNVEGTVIGFESNLTVFSRPFSKSNFHKFKGMSFDGKPFPLPCLVWSVKQPLEQSNDTIKNPSLLFITLHRILVKLINQLVKLCWFMPLCFCDVS